MALNSSKSDPLSLGKLDNMPRGGVFIKTNEMLIRQMVQNWLPNDLFWPTALLDNMPNFQLGELEVVRYNVRLLKDNLSRMRTTDKLDPFAEAAFTSLSNDPLKWWFPSGESKLKEGAKNLEFYRFNHGLGIRPPFTGFSESGAMIHRGADNGQPQGNVDAGHILPNAGAGIVLKADQFGGNMDLVMVHHHHGIVHPADHF